MVPASLVGYIETSSSGILNLIKELNKHQLEAVHGVDVHQDLTSLSTVVIFLKKNVGNNIQGSFPDLWSAVNDLSAQKKTRLKLDILETYADIPLLVPTLVRYPEML